MSDIIVYGYQEFGTNQRYMVLRSDGTIDCGSRFTYMESKIPFGYQSLVDALNRAIDEEEKHNGKQAVVNTKRKTEEFVPLDFDELMGEFNTIIANIPGSTDSTGETEEGKKFKEYYQPRITQIIEANLGKGKKIRDASREQVEHIRLIVDEVKELVDKK